MALSSRPTANVTMTLAPRIADDFPTEGNYDECPLPSFFCRASVIRGQSPDVASFVTVGGGHHSS
jgi:hypothetical protein